ncbi:MAG: hypothetical protein LBJ47_00505 [Tannerella sp.]|nr:hypothetical protein [Tannerella sp.]
MGTPKMKYTPYPVIARRNDEAIQFLSGISGLLHFVRNDGTGLLRRPYMLPVEVKSLKSRRRFMDETVHDTAIRIWTGKYGISL